MAKGLGKTFLPDYLQPAHDLCLLNHDILVELLQSGESHGVFLSHFKLSDDSEREALQNSSNILEWLENSDRVSERARLVRVTVFPAVLSDLLHFVYEALETSRKAKLNVTYALIRKPLQESLFLLEVNREQRGPVVQKYGDNALLLRAQKAGGFDATFAALRSVLEAMREQDRFDA